MPKMIDAERLKREVEELYAEAGTTELSFEQLAELIRNQENTGLTKVTRCRRCMEYIFQTGRCRRWGIHVRDDNNFCLYGLYLKGYNES